MGSTVSASWKFNSALRAQKAIESSSVPKSKSMDRFKDEQQVLPENSILINILMDTGADR